MASQTLSINEVNELIERAGECFKRGDVDGAYGLFAQAREADPTSIGALEGLTRIAYDRHAWDDLRVFCLEALELNPDNDQMLLYMARAATAQRNWPEAAPLWDKVGHARPGWTEPMFQSGRAWFRAGDRQAANAATEAFAAFGAADAVSLRLLGRVAAEVGLVPIALDAYRGMAEADPAMAAGEFAEQTRANEPRAALTCAAAMLAIEPNCINAEQLETLTTRLRQRAEQAEAAGALVAACSDYQTLAALSSAMASDDDFGARAVRRIQRVLLTPARESLKQDDIPAARQQYAAVLDLFPNDVEALQAYGRILMRLRDYNAALPVWARLSGLRSDLLECNVQIARVLERTGRYASASEMWRKVLAAEPSHAEATTSISNNERLMLGEVRAAVTEGRWFDAWNLLRDMREFIAAREEFVQRSEQVGRAVLRSMRAAFKDAAFNEILQLGEMACDLIPDEPEVWLLIGRAGMELRQYEVALPAWEKLQMLDPNSGANPLLQIARCHDRMGRRAEARAAAAAVLERDPEHAEALQIKSRS